MTGPLEEKERQPLAAPSTETLRPPAVDTDEWIHQMMVRLSSHEEVVRRPRSGN